MRRREDIHRKPGLGRAGRVGLGDGLARKALDSVRKHLAGPDGIVLQQPAYQTYHLELGEISSYPPGYKENAGVFTHNNTWIIIAEALLGDGGAAWDYYRRICPSLKEARIDTYRAEPYVYSQMTSGPDAAVSGEAKNSWLTGTAAWAYVAATQYILGIRPDFDGLRIDPCIPPEWKGFTVTRVFRGRTYRIEVTNPRGVSRGVRRLTVNGLDRPDNSVGIPNGSGPVHVSVELG